MVRNHARKADARRARTEGAAYRSAVERSRGKPRVATGLPGLDTLLRGGLRPGRVTVLAARTAMGKSMLALSIARHCAVAAGRPALIASLEMSRFELWVRLMAAESGLSSDRILRGLPEHERERVRGAAEDLDRRRAPLDLGGDGSIPAVSDIAAECERASRRYGRLDLVVVDYLGLIDRSGPGLSPHSHDRAVEVAAIVEALQKLARRFNAAVLLVEQLTRDVAERPDHRPRLGDMEHAEQLLPRAEAVIMLHRDEYYIERQSRRRYEQSPDPSVYPGHLFPRQGLPEPMVQRAELHVSLHRHGPTGITPVAVDLSRCCFSLLPDSEGRP
ncbi:DnaB-like helicase C-terminal domain-containing protein [Streptomyces antnestii]|uniref:DnaB-like helicase C-terminal domain-containing protein n=1 Tax=Streptomyces antnestii TaxID=2494256 RepID=UPI00167797DB|nr:DnaB-like helicase C-terminal domain-containing protein [Streptomyces sp. San01]